MSLTQVDIFHSDSLHTCYQWSYFIVRGNCACTNCGTDKLGHLCVAEWTQLAVYKKRYIPYFFFQSSYFSPQENTEPTLANSVDTKSPGGQVWRSQHALSTGTVKAFYHSWLLILMLKRNVSSLRIERPEDWTNIHIGQESDYMYMSAGRTYAYSRFQTEVNSIINAWTMWTHLKKFQVAAVKSRPQTVLSQLMRLLLVPQRRQYWLDDKTEDYGNMLSMAWILWKCAVLT